MSSRKPAAPATVERGDSLLLQPWVAVHPVRLHGDRPRRVRVAHGDAGAQPRPVGGARRHGGGDARRRRDVHAARRCHLPDPAGLARRHRGAHALPLGRLRRAVARARVSAGQAVAAAGGGSAAGTAARRAAGCAAADVCRSPPLARSQWPIWSPTCTRRGGVRRHSTWPPMRGSDPSSAPSPSMTPAMTASPRCCANACPIASPSPRRRGCSAWASARWPPRWSADTAARRANCWKRQRDAVVCAALRSGATLAAAATAAGLADASVLARWFRRRHGPQPRRLAGCAGACDAGTSTANGTAAAPVRAGMRTILLCCLAFVVHASEPDIRTPAPGPQPRLTGAPVFGVRPGHPLLHRLTAIGARPITFAATPLPAGVDARRGDRANCPAASLRPANTSSPSPPPAPTAAPSAASAWWRASAWR